MCKLFGKIHPNANVSETVVLYSEELKMMKKFGYQFKIIKAIQFKKIKFNR